MADVTIGGTAPDAVFEVDTSDSASELGSASIVVGDTEANRGISSGDRVVVQRPGGETWRGYVIGKPSRESEGTLEVQAADTRYELKQRDLSRVFYNMDAGAAVREAVEYEAEGRGERRIHEGGAISGWSSDAHVLELGGFDGERIHERGSDVVFVGLREGATGTFSAKYDGLPESAAPGGRVTRLETRMLVNDPGEQLSVEVELRDASGNSYTWGVDRPGTNFDVHELRAEEAEPSGSGGGPWLEYRFDVSGRLSENIGAAIDWASAYTFALRERDTDIGTSGVADTGRTITRRVDKSVLELLQDLETEEGFASWVDDDDELHFQQSGGEVTDKSVVRGETPVTSAKFNTDYDAVHNKVTVRGNPGKDVQVTIEDSASIAFYGVAPRSEPLVDEELQSDPEAEARGRGYLEEHAWDDTVAEFEVADSSYQAVSKGDAIYVDWPPRSLEGFFVVEEAESDSGGVVTLVLGVRA